MFKSIAESNSVVSNMCCKLQLCEAEKHYNDENTKIKFWWYEILNEFQGKTKDHHKTWVLTKAKALLEKYATWQLSSFVKNVIVIITSLKVQQYQIFGWFISEIHWQISSRGQVWISLNYLIYWHQLLQRCFLRNTIKMFYRTW